MTEHKYERIARLIREDLPEPGSTLPSEHELLERFDVSRSTIRLALRQLETEGLITSSQGSLRTVREARRWCWPMSSWEKGHSPEADARANTIQEQGGTPTTQVTVSFVAAEPAVARALDVDEGETVVLRSRLLSINGEPHQFSDSYFPRWVADNNPAFTTPGDQSAPGGLLAASGHHQKKFHDEITARMPTTKEATTLRMPSGTPMLVHTRTGYDSNHKPLRYMVTRMAADRVELSYDLDA